MKKQLTLVSIVCCVVFATAFTSVKKTSYIPGQPASVQSKLHLKGSDPSSGFIVHHGVFSTEATDLRDYDIEFSFNMSTQVFGYVKITQAYYPYDYKYGTMAASSGMASSNGDGTGIICPSSPLVTFEFQSFFDPLITDAIYFNPGETLFDY